MKNDPSLPPRDANAIQAVTPADMSSWPGPGVRLTPQSKRTGLEEKWFALTGRVVGIKAETDGDLHIALADATADKPGIVVCEVPAKPEWCEIRNTIRRSSPLPAEFFDIGHALKDQSNRRSHQPGYAAWEIHPVMALHVDQ